ncbi:MAG: ABC transporter permease [Planctomycetes bacterium]|nr:ABC transporter permease [Planctomycetota bacterium]
MKHLSFFLCFKYLCRKKIVLLSIASVAMCCGLLIVVSSLFSGFIAAVENSASENMGDVVIDPYGSMRVPDYDELISELEKVDVVEAATAVLSSNGGLLFLGKGNVRAVLLWGIEVGRRDAVSPFSKYLVGSGGVDIGDEVAVGYVGIGVVAKPDAVTDEYDYDEVGEFVGRKVRLTTAVSGSDKPRRITFHIADISQTGVHQFDSNFVYMPIEELSEQLYPGKGKIADMIQIKLVGGADEEAAVDKIRGVWREFGKKKKLDWASPLDVETSRLKQARLIGEYRKQMGMLMLIFGVVSGGVILLIFCIFYLIVMTKIKDIAIIKSCGLGSSGVAVLFVFFGLVVGVAGSGFGILIGWLMTKNINAVEAWVSSALGLNLWKSSTYMFSRIPNVVYWDYVYWIAGAAIVAAALGALVPAIAASRVRPVRILRYE